MNTYQCRCCACGKYTSWDSDSSAPYGSCYDLEPPDNEFYCPKCVKKEIAYYTEKGWIPTEWIPARWNFVVARNLGWIRITNKYHGRWHNPKKPMPKGYMLAKPAWRIQAGWPEETIAGYEQFQLIPEVYFETNPTWYRHGTAEEYDLWIDRKLDVRRDLAPYEELEKAGYYDEHNVDFPDAG